MFTKEDYEIAKENGLEERFRGDEISYRIGLEVPLSEQIAILMDEDIKPEKHAAFQELRSQIKAEVDAEIAAFENN